MLAQFHVFLPGVLVEAIFQLASSLQFLSFYLYVILLPSNHLASVCERVRVFVVVAHLETPWAIHNREQSLCIPYMCSV